MLDVKNCIKKWTNKLVKNGITNASNEVYFMLNDILGMDKAKVLITPKFKPMQYWYMNHAVNRRSKHVPLQLVIGKSKFLDITIIENKYTLTPRPETEYLAQIIRDDNQNPKAVLDMCAGSGCIGLSLAKAGHKVTLVDISRGAIKSIKKNAQINDLEVSVIRSDFFNKVTGKYDIIVSNPPYLDEGDMKGVSVEVKKYDPYIALFGGIDGVFYFEQLSMLAHRYLNRRGVVYVEFGKNQENAIAKLLERHFTDITIIKDLNGVNRFIKARVKDIRTK